VDTRLLVSLNSLVSAHQHLQRIVVAYVETSPFLIAGMVVLLFIVGRAETRRGALLAALSACTAVLIAQLVAAAVDRARPFVALPDLVHVLVHHEPDRSFPSDSATAAFAIATALMVRAPRWGRIVLVLAGALGIGRVAVGMHYPTDVLAGALLGAAVATAIVAMASAARRGRASERACATPASNPASLS
jgi:undecaprenyl-diphosphatase